MNPPRSAAIRALAATLRDRRVRFLMVGGFNVVQGIAWFALLDRLIGDQVGYLLTLVLTYVLAIPTGFWLYRRFVFTVTGQVLTDFLRFTSVQATSFAMNLVALPFIHEVLRVPLVPAQVLAMVVIVCFNYVAHAFFSFRRLEEPVEGLDPTAPVQATEPLRRP